MLNAQAVMAVDDIGGIAQQTYYGIASIVVALATLIGAVASYKSIVNKSSVTNYEKLEERVNQDRAKFNERLDARDVEHRAQLDEIIEENRLAIAEQEKRHRKELGDVANEVSELHGEVNRLGRVIEISKAHVLRQDTIIRSLGKAPETLPVELRLFNAASGYGQEGG